MEIAPLEGAYVSLLALITSGHARNQSSIAGHEFRVECVQINVADHISDAARGSR